MRTFPQGTEVQIKAIFTEALAGALVDPARIVLRLKAPISGLQVYTYGVGIVIGREAAGIYRTNRILDEPGLWGFRWESSISVTAAVEGSFLVKEATP